MIKNIFHFIAVLLFVIPVALNAQTPATIKKSNYTVTAATGTVTLIASESIILEPGTFIQSGSTFTAKISPVNEDIYIPIDAPISGVPFISQSENYIFNRVFQTPMTTVNGIKNANDVEESITYFDGLGRPVQNIALRQGGDGSNIITHIEYDGFGRQVKDYLPFSIANNSDYSKISSQEALNGTISFYNNDKYGNTSNPFSQKKLEASPLNRVLKQAAPGTSWAMNSGHEIKLDYQTNAATEVKLYQATVNWDPGSGLYETAFFDAGYYAMNELYKNITYDENTTANPTESAGSTVEFKNKEGQIVLKRTYESGAKHDTYYVYDIYGNLTYVIPPKADGSINTDVLNGLCYQYKYDNHNRLVEKKLPGKQWEFIVYDKLDRPVATGPALSPFRDDSGTGWLITKYDVFGRPIYTGWKNQTVDSAARNSLQIAQNSATALFETKTDFTIDGVATKYNNSIAPTTFKLLTVNYYDDYTFPEAQAIPSIIMGQTVLTNVKSLPTGSWTRSLTTSSSIAGETTTIFYDYKGRAISTYIKNHLAGISHTDNEIDFTGKPLNSITEHQHTSGGTKISIKEKFTYSAQNRLLTHTHQIGEGTVQLLADNAYDQLGQLTSKKVGNTTANPLQKIDYIYNIRGWLTGINNVNDLQPDSSAPKDLFAFRINYDEVNGNKIVSAPLYNGNIAETFWSTGSDGGVFRGYGYKYDQLNRLIEATYQTPKLTDNKNYFGENLNYDKNGNITHMNRKFMAGLSSNPYADDMDNLGYFYNNNSNQLMKVTDATNNPQGFKDDSNGYNDNEDDYAYDNNGNLVKDQNKNITAISYNHLNLPKKITFGSGNTIEYIYNAAGQKLEKNVTENSIVGNTKYLTGFQYKNDVLQFFPTAEGYVRNTSINPSINTFDYVFNYTDHLGNVRVSYFKNAQNVLEILEENNYYPFGLKHQGYNTDNLQPGYKYKYNGKEFQDELGLNTYDYGFRHYMPDIGRMGNIDMLAELAYDMTPNRYCFNNPMRFIDPSGLWETTNGGYKTDRPEDIKRFMSYLGFENNALNNNPDKKQISTFIGGEMSAGGQGTLSNGSTLADEFSITTYKQEGGGIKGYADKKSFDNFWHGVQKNLTPDGLNTRTIGQNIFGLSYPGGNNPQTYSGVDDFSYVPTSIAEYPAIGHDRRYGNLGTAGAKGLLTDTKAIGSDFRFVTLSLVAVGNTDSFKEKAQAFSLGVGLGTLASFKTFYLFKTQGTLEAISSILHWDSVANKGVTNTPTNQ